MTRPVLGPQQFTTHIIICISLEVFFVLNEKNTDSVD